MKESGQGEDRGRTTDKLLFQRDNLKHNLTPRVGDALTILREVSVPRSTSCSMYASSTAEEKERAFAI
jgi:hypothetical protein